MEMQFIDVKLSILRSIHNRKCSSKVGRNTKHRQCTQVSHRHADLQCHQVHVME